jgi:hypothetical protein
MKTFLTALIICIASACTVPVKSLSDCQLDVSRSSTTAVMTCKDHEPIQLPNFDPAFVKCVRGSETTVPVPVETPDAGPTDVDNGEN